MAQVLERKRGENNCLNKERKSAKSGKHEEEWETDGRIEREVGKKVAKGKEKRDDPSWHMWRGVWCARWGQAYTPSWLSERCTPPPLSSCPSNHPSFAFHWKSSALKGPVRSISLLLSPLLSSGLDTFPLPPRLNALLLHRRVCVCACIEVYTWEACRCVCCPNINHL